MATTKPVSMADYAPKMSAALTAINAATQLVIPGGDPGGMAVLCEQAMKDTKAPEDVLRHIPDAQLLAIALKYVGAVDAQLRACAKGDLDAATFQVERATGYLKLMGKRIDALPIKPAD